MKHELIPPDKVLKNSLLFSLFSGNLIRVCSCGAPSPAPALQAGLPPARLASQAPRP